MNEYSAGTLRKFKVTRKDDDGNRNQIWVWQGIVTITDPDGKRSHRQANLKDKDGNLIEADEDKDRKKGHRTAEGGRGYTTAKRALSKWIESVKDEDRRKADDALTKLTVYECVDQYIESSFEGGFIEASTLNDYRKCASRIRATLKDGPVDDLTPDLLNRWQRDLGKRYVHTTVKKTRSVLRSAVQDAMDNGRTSLEKNPVITRRRTIRQRRRSKETAPKLNALDKTNRSTILAEIDAKPDTPVTVAARIGLYAGLREAEVCALQWKDVDLEDGFITVSKAIGTAKGGIYVKPQKNDAEDRDVPINPELAASLSRWKVHQQEIALKLGVDLSQTFVIGDPSKVPPRECFAFLDGTDRTADDPDDAAKLIGNPDAKPEGVFHPARLSREWRTLSQNSNARGMLGKPASFHNLRHTFGFYSANEGGVKIEQLAEWMGHESIETTRKYYVAKDREAARRRGREAMDQMASRGVVRDVPADVEQLKAV